MLQITYLFDSERFVYCDRHQNSTPHGGTPDSTRMDFILTLFMPVIFWIAIWLACTYASRCIAKRGLTTDPVPQIYPDLEKCEWILQGCGMAEDASSPVQRSLRSRAIPNQRLIRAFAIDNAFTTTDENHYRQFRRRAELLLKINDQRWKQIAHTATRSARLTFPVCPVNDNRREILLVPFVQRMVLKFSMHVLFSVPVDELDDDAVAIIAEKINSLWVSSKSCKPTESMHWDQQELRAAMQKIFPQAGDTARDNPLNLILPAYETMWRVVLRCFLELRFRAPDSAPDARQILATFLADPSRATFETAAPEAGGISAAFVVDEALRLYPPTRRIYRQQNLDGLKPQLVAADIEHLHRDPRVWGEDALLFRPSRWIGMSKGCRRAFLPFGSKPFTCPAKNDAGPRMIGALVAALLAVFGEGWEWVAMIPEDSIAGEEPLTLGRDCFHTLVLREPFA